MQISFCRLCGISPGIATWLVTLNPLPYSQISILHHSIHETAKANGINKMSLRGLKLVRDKNRLFIRRNEKRRRIL